MVYEYVLRLEGLLWSFILGQFTTAASVPCTAAPAETETITIMNTITATVVMSQSSVSCLQAGSLVTETQTITESRTLAQTVFVSQTPDNVLNQSSESTGSQAAWMAVAIIFIILALVGATLSVIFGCLLCKKSMMLGKSSTVSSNSKKPLPEGELRHRIYNSLQLNC